MVVVLVFPQVALVLLNRQLKTRLAVIEVIVIAVRLRCRQIEATVLQCRHETRCHPFRHAHHSPAVHQGSLDRKIEAGLEHGDGRRVHDVVQVEEAVRRFSGEDCGGVSGRAGAICHQGHVTCRCCRLGSNGRRARRLRHAMNVASGDGQQQKGPGQTKCCHCC